MSRQRDNGSSCSWAQAWSGNRQLLWIHASLGQEHWGHDPGRNLIPRINAPLPPLPTLPTAWDFWGCRLDCAVNVMWVVGWRQEEFACGFLLGRQAALDVHRACTCFSGKNELMNLAAVGYTMQAIALCYSGEDRFIFWVVSWLYVRMEKCIEVEVGHWESTTCIYTLLSKLQIEELNTITGINSISTHAYMYQLVQVSIPVLDFFGSS